MKDKAVAEDVVQDVFVKFWKKIHKLENQNNLKSYLFTSTKNRSIEIIRKNNRVQEHKDVLTREQLNNQVSEEDMDRFIRLDKIHKAIKELPPRCQQVFTLSKLEGLTYQEIADELGISIKTVENQIVRALKLLRERLT